MKALAGMLLAFALAAGTGNEAGAQHYSSRSTKHVTKTTVKHQQKIEPSGCVCKAEKSKLVLTGRLTEVNSLPTNCVCSAGKTTTKQVTTTSAIKSNELGTSMMKTKSFGGYKRVDNTRINTGKTGQGLHSNEGPNRGILRKPFVDSLNSNLDGL